MVEGFCYGNIIEINDVTKYLMNSIFGEKNLNCPLLFFYKMHICGWIKICGRVRLLSVYQTVRWKQDHFHSVTDFWSKLWKLIYEQSCFLYWDPQMIQSGNMIVHYHQLFDFFGEVISIILVSDSFRAYYTPPPPSLSPTWILLSKSYITTTTQH